jgi:WXXGXW repeat (2 copies)
MTKSSWPAILAGALAAALAGCVVAPYSPPPAESAPVADQGTEEQAPEAPPPLPTYDQPPVPEEGYVWIPGAWRWGPEGYFWVPGTWVAPPQVGFLWTPGYWAFSGAVYLFHPGHWGEHVGYYGGINYGHGYYGSGYVGGRWVNNTFQYNTTVTNVNVTNVHNVYRQTVVNNVNITNTNVTRVSYLGASGTHVQPTHAEAAAAHEPRMSPTQLQQQHHDTARITPQQNAARNQGRPPIAATPRANAYAEHGVTAAKPVGPVYRPPPHPPAHEDKKSEH